MFLFKLRVVGGPLLWEALGHGLLGLGLKRALPLTSGRGHLACHIEESAIGKIGFKLKITKSMNNVNMYIARVHVYTKGVLVFNF